MAVCSGRRLSLPFPARLPLACLLLFPLLIHPLLFLFLCPPALPVLLYFFIYLSLIIWSLRGLLRPECPIGCKGSRRQGRGIDRTPIDRAEYAQAQADQHYASHHCSSLLMWCAHQRHLKAPPPLQVAKPVP